MATASSEPAERRPVGGHEGVVLASGDGRVLATLVPSLAMLCWSLTLDGEELLAHPNGIEEFASGWATTGIPLLHPWANRLGGDRLVGTRGPTIVSSARVPRDANGLPIHGLNLADAGWRLVEATKDRVAAALSFDDPELLAIFPFPHRLAVRAIIEGHALRVLTVLVATGPVAVPVSFGWHPYFRIPGLSREAWEVSLPVRRRGELDGRMLPTGRDHPIHIPPGRLGDAMYDDLFTALDPHPRFRLAAGGWSLTVDFDEGYPVAQVYAPPGRDLIAFEPMTAPGNALVSGRSLRFVEPGGRYSAQFDVTPRRDVSTST